ncbi:MAG: hypothetical protein KME26_17095 [Oscillatoria princeps RMCB-10]|nr:hypothetical protein [Oscillatoria princeps RMCB-10]
MKLFPLLENPLKLPLRCLNASGGGGWGSSHAWVRRWLVSQRRCVCWGNSPTGGLISSPVIGQDKRSELYAGADSI